MVHISSIFFTNHLFTCSLEYSLHILMSLYHSDKYFNVFRLYYYVYTPHFLHIYLHNASNIHNCEHSNNSKYISQVSNHLP